MIKVWELISKCLNETLYYCFQFIAVSCVLALAGAAPAADAEADPQLLAAAPLAYAAAPVAVAASNCAPVVEILTTQTCAPRAENVCTTQVVDTEEIEYEKVCKEVTDVICDAPAAPYVAAAAPVAVATVAKREAEAEADPQYLLGGYHAAPLAAAAPVVAPAVHAVAHSVKATVKHACREVVTEHCVDNPIIKKVSYSII